MTISGTAGSEYISGDLAGDVIAGNQGNDTIKGAAGDDFLLGNTEDDLVVGDSGADSIYGGRNNDFLLGNVGNDVVYGDLGNDWLFGGQGQDTLYGGEGDDTLSGDRGADMLIGGEGADNFQFNVRRVFMDGTVDKIMDFELGVDKISLKNGDTSLLSFEDAGSDVHILYDGVLVGVIVGMENVPGNTDILLGV